MTSTVATGRVSEAAAYALLPAGSVWSCSFGYPGELGFCEYHHAPDGSRWVISNGRWDSHPHPDYFEWTCKSVGA